jgi:hypothetical protein
MVDVCRALIEEYVHVNAIVCPLDYANDELEVDVDGSPAPCPFLKVG